MKRTIDVLLAAVALVLCAPFLGMLALAVKLDSPGPVIFSQPRLGQGGRIFNVHKFRKFLDSWEDAGPGVTMAGDARMTRVGRFLERSKLDELPQLWNILRGEMSFVGPRPESLRYKDLFTGEFARVLDFLPGIFGPNQVAFRNESELYPPDRDPDEFYRQELFPDKACRDIEYFSRANPWSDLAWIAHGLWGTLTGILNWRRIIGMHGPIVVLDLMAIEIAWLGANVLRFEGMPPPKHMEMYMTGIWLLPLVIFPVLVLAGCYRQPVRHFAIGGALRLGAGSVFGWMMGQFLLLGFFHRGGSVSLAPLGLLLVLPLMGLPRIWRRERWRQEIRNHCSVQHRSRVAIYGAGRRGATLVPFLEQGFADLEVIGFLDDNDREMRGREIVGRKVLGSERDLDTAHAVYGVDQIWLTFEPDVHKYERLSKWCGENDIELVVLPMIEPFASMRTRERESKEYFN